MPWGRSIQTAGGAGTLAGRGSDPDFRRFLWHSVGSCNELDSQLLLGHDLKFIPSAVHTHLGNDLSEVRKMLVGLIQALT